MYIYIFPTLGCSSLWQRNITAATCVMQSSPNELSTPGSDSAKCKRTKFDT